MDLLTLLLYQYQLDTPLFRLKCRVIKRYFIENLFSILDMNFPFSSPRIFANGSFVHELIDTATFEIKYKIKINTFLNWFLKDGSNMEIGKDSEDGM